MKNIGGETEIRWWNQLGGEKFGGEIYLVVKNTVVINSVVKNVGGEISSVVKDSVVKCATPFRGTYTN